MQYGKVRVSFLIYKWSHYFFYQFLWELAFLQAWPQRFVVYLWFRVSDHLCYAGLPFFSTVIVQFLTNRGTVLFSLSHSNSKLQPNTWSERNQPHISITPQIKSIIKHNNKREIIKPVKNCLGHTSTDGWSVINAWGKRWIFHTFITLNLFFALFYGSIQMWLEVSVSLQLVIWEVFVWKVV